MDLGSKRGPESCWLGLIKPCGICLLKCEDHDAGLSAIGSRLGRIYCVLLLTGTAVWTLADDATEIGIVR